MLFNTNIVKYIGLLCIDIGLFYIEILENANTDKVVADKSYNLQTLSQRNTVINKQK